MAYDFAPAVILGIDSAKTVSGSTLLVPHIEPRPQALLGRSDKLYARIPPVRSYTLEHFCEVRTQADHENCVMHLMTRAQELGLPPMVVAESWTPGRWGFAQIIGMGEGWGWWTAELRRAVERFPEVAPVHVERVTPARWREDLGIYHLAESREGPALKRAAIQYVKAKLNVRVPADVAEAAAVALWGAQNDNVHERVEKWHVKQAQLRRKKASSEQA